VRIANNLIGRKAEVVNNGHLKGQIVEIVALIRTRHGWLISVLDSKGRIHEDLDPHHLKVFDLIVSDKDLVAIVEDVKDQPHPDTWSHCGQREVLSITSELQSLRAADKRVATVLKALGRPDYIPLLQDDGGRSAHHNVVKVVSGAISGDPEFASFWS